MECALQLCLWRGDEAVGADAAAAPSGRPAQVPFFPECFEPIAWTTACLPAPPTSSHGAAARVCRRSSAERVRGFNCRNSPVHAEPDQLGGVGLAAAWAEALRNHLWPWPGLPPSHA